MIYHLPDQQEKDANSRPNGRRGTSVITKILAACLLAKPKSCSCYKICFRSRKREKENERGTSSRMQNDVNSVSAINS